MPFDQISQADFQRATKIVGTKIESLDEHEAHITRKESAAAMACTGYYEFEFLTNPAPFGSAHKLRKMA
jgi:hypothetical protein